MPLLTYKNFYGTTEKSVENNKVHYHGKILLVKDLVTYGADASAWLQKAFEEAVNNYLETCQQVGKVAESSSPVV